LIEKTASADRPPVGFCMEPLLGSKYAGLASGVLCGDWNPYLKVKCKVDCVQFVKKS